MKTAPLLFVVLGIALLGVLFLAMKPKPADPVAPPAPAAAAAVAAPAAQPAPAPEPAGPQVVEYRVEKGQRVAGPEVIALRQGETVVIRILADADDELHLHGYDQHAHVHAGQAAELTLVAEHSGRFELELHKSHAQLGVLEVQPQ